ncbi:protein-export chaperone SecB [Brevibacterium sp. JNUCC-42]|nr:protein-export chaperone SecB [Brevibacterium sp. JNUCC-42]
MMDKSITSGFTLENYTLDSINFMANPDFNFDDPLEINFQLDIDVKINDENDVGMVTLRCKVFKEPIENNYPFTVEVSLRGIFKANNAIPEEQFRDFCRINGTTTLFPFLRSAIADVTKAANVEPLLLPLININNIFENMNNAKG